MRDLSLVPLLCLVLLLFSQALRADSFIVEKIRIEGLERLADGTLLNYLPVSVGDPLDERAAVFSISELYKTGFFTDIRLYRDGATLIVKVRERPSISSVNFSGNSDIDDDALKEALKGIGITRGEIFNRSLLTNLTRELENVYFSQGKYGVEINSEVTPLDQNRVDIDITISEGDVALIKHINIIGNAVFDDETLLDELQSGVPGAWSLFSSIDEYSKPKLNADLETIRSYYLDRGYVKFTIDSTQVSITPDKKDIYITINVTEGEQYRVSQVDLTGEMVVNRLIMQSQILTREGEIFSRSLMTSSKKNLEDQMGKIGYAFSSVQVTPVIDDEKREIALTYHLLPGKKVYVRRINVFGNDNTNDEVFRREMRLMEGSILASDRLERSKIRLQRLPYIENVEIEKAPVPGTDNQVDLNLKLDEKLAGSFNIGAGFSQTQGFVFNVGMTQENLLGTGKRLNLNINTDRANTVYSAAYTNPYYTLDGISRTLSASYRDRNASEELINNFQTSSGDINISYGIPLSEYNTLSLGYGYSHISITPSAVNPSNDVSEFVGKNGDLFNSLTLNASFSHDTRNRTVFATSGIKHTIGLNMTVPGSDLEYYKLSYVTKNYLPLTTSTALLFRSNIAYGNGYGRNSELPFFERYFAGGIRTVRGYESNSLGPRDKDTNLPIGGNLRVSGGIDYIIPIPFMEKPPSSVRLSAFFDIGNVYLDNRATFDSADIGFQASQLRQSVGISFVWVSPIGPLRFSWAETLNERPGDNLRAFQFSIGSFF